MSESNVAADLSPLTNAEDTHAPDLNSESLGAQTPTNESELRSEEHKKLDEYYDVQTNAAALDRLKAERAEFVERRATRRPENDEEFHPWADCDAVLGVGTVVLIGDVETRLLNPVPVSAPAFREEAVFVEKLVAEDLRNLAANANFLRQRYNPNGRVIGRNDQHPLNQLDDEIARLEAELEGEREAERARSKETASSEKAE